MNQQDTKQAIQTGKTVLGIEFVQQAEQLESCEPLPRGHGQEPRHAARPGETSDPAQGLPVNRGRHSFHG